MDRRPALDRERADRGVTADDLILGHSLAEVLGPKGQRTIELARFFRAPKSEKEREHVLEPNELVVSVTFPAPLGVAKTIVLWPPLNAGSLADRTFEAFCASVPGMVNTSLVFPPLATATTIAARAAVSQTARTSRRRRNAKWASRYK